MTKAYEVLITRTSKAVASSEPYRIFDREVKHFQSLTEVKQFIKDEYGKVKRKMKMFIDSSDGGAGSHSGWIYGFRNKDWSHNEPEYMQEDWVEVFEVKRKRVVIN